VTLPSYIKAHNGAFLLQVYVQPRASRAKIIGMHDKALKVAITAPPVDGEANAAVIDLFSDLLKIPKRQLTLTSGHKGRRKAISITGISLEKLLEVLGDFR
jgi:uncharacterized protein (TIGR00251 family)